MRQLAMAGVPLQTIATRLGRSPSAIRNKATMHGIALRTRARNDISVNTDRSQVRPLTQSSASRWS